MKRFSAAQLRDSQMAVITKAAATMPSNDWHSSMELNRLEALQHIAYNLHILADNTATVKEDAFNDTVNANGVTSDLIAHIEQSNIPNKDSLLDTLRRIAYSTH